MHIHDHDPHPVSERSEGLALLMQDALQNVQQPLDWPRLCCWHQWLFSDQGVSFNRRPLRVGQLRGDEPIQVVSSRLDRPKVHFEAQTRDRLMAELEVFIRWFNASRADLSQDPLLRAAVCHLWFVTLHPFDDGNGRITRALTDMALAQADDQSIQLYAMSVAILDRRQDYYRILERTQRGGLDITHWTLWFFDTLDNTLDGALAAIDRTLAKARFWRHSV